MELAKETIENRLEDILEYIHGNNIDVSSYSCKLVKTRKAHTCASSSHYYPMKRDNMLIPIGETAAVETAIIPDEGFQTAYTCWTCLERGYKDITQW